MFGERESCEIRNTFLGNRGVGGLTLGQQLVCVGEGGALVKG